MEWHVLSAGWWPRPPSIRALNIEYLLTYYLTYFTKKQ